MTPYQDIVRVITGRFWREILDSDNEGGVAKTVIKARGNGVSDIYHEVGPVGPIACLI